MLEIVKAIGEIVVLGVVGATVAWNVVDVIAVLVGVERCFCNSRSSFVSLFKMVSKASEKPSNLSVTIFRKSLCFNSETRTYSWVIFVVIVSNLSEMKVIILVSSSEIRSLIILEILVSRSEICLLIVFVMSETLYSMFAMTGGIASTVLNFVCKIGNSSLILSISS